MTATDNSPVKTPALSELLTHPYLDAFGVGFDPRIAGKKNELVVSYGDLIRQTAAGSKMTDGEVEQLAGRLAYAADNIYDVGVMVGSNPGVFYGVGVGSNGLMSSLSDFESDSDDSMDWGSGPDEELDDGPPASPTPLFIAPRECPPKE